MSLGSWNSRERNKPEPPQEKETPYCADKKYTEAKPKDFLSRVTIASKILNPPAGGKLRLIGKEL